MRSGRNDPTSGKNQGMGRLTQHHGSPAHGFGVRNRDLGTGRGGMWTGGRRRGHRVNRDFKHCRSRAARLHSGKKLNRRRLEVISARHQAATSSGVHDPMLILVFVEISLVLPEKGNFPSGADHKDRDPVRP